MIRKLKSKDYLNFLSYCKKYDKYKDFYISKNGRRNYLFKEKVAKKVFNYCLKNSGLCYLKLVDSEITGIALILKEDGKKFIRTLGNSKNDLSDLFKYLKWHHRENLYIRVKKQNNFLVYSDRRRNIKVPKDFLQKHNFTFKIISSDKDEFLMTNKRG